jgi:hypothetical protein
MFTSKKGSSTPKRRLLGSFFLTKKDKSFHRNLGLKEPPAWYTQYIYYLESSTSNKKLLVNPTVPNDEDDHATTEEIEENNGVYIEDETSSVGTIIKKAAIEIHKEKFKHGIS